MKIGLVLGGGGGKGAYELGVWKALVSLGLDKYISFFSGTSIGAFNAALFAQGDIEIAEYIWQNITIDTIVPYNKFELFTKGLGLLIGGKNLTISKRYITQKMNEKITSKDAIKEIANNYIDVDKIRKNKRICYAACTELPDFKIKYFKVNEYNTTMAKEIILASASLPLIFDPTEINGVKYVDGSICDNVPIQPVYGEGCDILIVVPLSKEERVDKSLYPNAKIIEIYPKNSNEGVINGTLNLDEEKKKSRIKEGYEDTISLLEPIMEITKYKIIAEEKEKNPKLYKIYNFAKNIMK